MKQIAITLTIILIICACGRKDTEQAQKPVEQPPSTMEQVHETEMTETPTNQENKTAESEANSTASNSTERTAELSVEDFSLGRIEMPRPGVISKYDKIVRKYARRYLFDWRLISAQIYAESTFNPRAKSYVGALGLMQVMPKTAQWLEGKAERETPELEGAAQLLLEPEVNIHLGCYYNAMLFNRIQNVEDSNEQHKMMFSAYNAGFGNLSKARRRSNMAKTWEGIKSHLPRETRNYIPKIYRKYEIYKQWAVLTPY